MKRSWVIGDIHGCQKTFRHLVENQLHISHRDTIYLLGDYVSKGPDSKGVLDYIFYLQRQHYQIISLMGNHEELLLAARTDESEAQRLFKHGGKQILRSFGVSTLSDIPQPYFDWLEKLPSCLELKDYVLAHAGLNFNISYPFADEKAMRWIRNFEVKPEMIGYRILVHGHSPVALEVTQYQLNTEPPTVINLDGGCVYRHRPDQAHLLALELNSRTLVVQNNIED